MHWTSPDYASHTFLIHVVAKMVDQAKTSLVMYGLGPLFVFIGPTAYSEMHRELQKILFPLFCLYFILQISLL